MSFQFAEPAFISDCWNPGSVFALGVKMQALDLTFFSPLALVDDPVETKMTLLSLAEMQER